MLAVERAASHGRCYARQWIKGSNVPVRAEGQHGPGTQTRPNRRVALGPFRSDAFLRPASIVSAVVRLHGGNDPASGKAWDILRAQMLCMFDAKAAVARPVLCRDLLEDLKNLIVRPIANGVNHYLK